MHCLLVFSCLDNVQGLILANTEKFEHHISHCWQKSELLFGGGHNVFPFHTVTFGLRVTVVDPSFITSDYATEKVITFLMIPIQKAITNVQMDTQMLFGELFGNPS
jgi:hypothetical protein